MLIKPNFLIIGAARCATTTLYHWLKSHPEVYLPSSPRPEPHFFFKESEYIKANSYYINTYFATAKDELAIGEKSTSYLFGESCAQRIFAFNPGMKLICCFREPMERSLSNFQFTKKNGFDDYDFILAINEEEERLKSQDQGETFPHAYVGRSKYGTQLQNYLCHFPKENFLFLVDEEIRESPHETFEKVTDFLSLSRNPLPIHLIAKMNSSNENTKEQLGKYLPFIKKDILQGLINEIDILEKISEKDLSHWKETLNRYV